MSWRRLPSGPNRSAAPELDREAAGPAEVDAQTFLFADLAGYTALTEVHGDEAAAEIVHRFTGQVARLLGDHGATQIKTIGDEVMAKVGEAEEAVALGLRIVAELAAHAAPPIRVGMHTGPAIERDGDWFGAAVNLASRVAGAAKPGEVLLTEATKAALPSGSALELRPRGERWFKNVPQRIPVYAAHRDLAGEVEFTVDPVCRMAVDPARSAESVEHRGTRYHFCSDACESTFSADPRRFVVRSPRARRARARFLSHLRVFAIAQLGFLAAWGVGLALGASPFPWFAFVLLGWGVPLALHLRAVRPLL